MSDRSKLINPRQRNEDAAELERALKNLEYARTPLIDKAKQTGQKPSGWDLLTTGVPEQVKLWWHSGPMAGTAPPDEGRSYFRDNADKRFDEAVQRAISEGKPPSGWKLP